MFGDQSQRTEKPTPRRLDKARREGNVPRTRELPGAVALAGFLVFCHLAGGDWLARLEALVSRGLATVARPDLNGAGLADLLFGMATSTAPVLVLPLGVMLVAGLAGNLIQGTPPMTLRPLNPDLSRLNPVKGLGKLFQLKGWVEMLKTSLKMVLFAAIALSAVRDSMDQGLPGAPGAEGALAAIFAISGRVIFRVVLLAFALGLLDLLFQRYDHVRRLRMTKQELKDERRETEGDPLVKARLRSKQLALARSRMMADVPKSSVVIINPTQFAVALRYVPGETDVPQLMAKGRAKLAERIREIARAHGIPIVSDPPLARALYRSVPVGGHIPAALFRAVAEVLALVFRDEAPRRDGSETRR